MSKIHYNATAPTVTDGQTVEMQSDAAGNLKTTAGGPAADDAAASGNPIPVGGIYNTTLPTYSNADRTQFQFGSRGSVNVTLWPENSNNSITTVATNADGASASAVASRFQVSSLSYQFNGTTFDRARNNTDLTVFASAARTATPTPYDGTNYNGRGLHLVIDATAASATPSVVFTIQGLDVISGKYYTILASAAVTGISTTILRVYPGLTVAANLVASDILPRSWRVIATHGDADSLTYSVGASVIL